MGTLQEREEWRSVDDHTRNLFGCGMANRTDHFGIIATINAVLFDVFDIVLNENLGIVGVIGNQIFQFLNSHCGKLLSDLGLLSFPFVIIV